MRRVSRVIATVSAALALLVSGAAVILVAPLPPDRSVAHEISPDGRYVAKFSWRPAGLIGMVTRDNPWVYLTVVESESGRVLERHYTWGDTPADACHRLGSLVPWHSGVASSECKE